MRLPRYLAFLNKSFLLLLLYIFLSAVLMSFSDNNSLRGIRWAMLHAVEFTDSIKEGLIIRGNLEKQNEFLREENFYLHIANQQLRETVLENARLRKLLELQAVGKQEYITAKVIGWSTEPGIGSVILDTGEQDSVFKNQAVINADGLVGKVISTTSRQSVVQLLKDHNSFTSARLQNSRENGTISWKGGDALELNFIPKNIPVDLGEVVVTSGLSQIYPPQLKIGVVNYIRDDDHDLFKQIRIQPAVNFNALEEVFILKKTTIPETESIE